MTLPETAPDPVHGATALPGATADTAAPAGRSAPAVPPGWHTTPAPKAPAESSTADDRPSPHPAGSSSGIRPPAGLGPGHNHRPDPQAAQPRRAPASASPVVLPTPDRQVASSTADAVDTASSTAPTLPAAPSPAMSSPPPALSSPVPGWARAFTTAAVVVVALVAAVVSYEHMREVGAAAGEGWRSWLLPLSVDGLIVAASMTMLVRRRRGQPAGWLAWSSLLLGIAASIAANVASADPGPIPRLVAAWSPLALLLAVELLMQQGRTPTTRRRRHGASPQAGRVPADLHQHPAGPR